MPKRETVQVGGQTLDLIISGPDVPTESEDRTEAQGTEVTFSPGEIYGPITHKLKEQQSEADFLASLGTGDKAAYLAFKEDNWSDPKAETWLTRHMTAEGWLAYVAFKKYGEGGTLTHTEKVQLAQADRVKAAKFGKPPEGVLWG